MRHFAAALVLSAVSLPICSQDIDEEVMSFIIEPCLAHLAELNGMHHVLPKDEALEALKASNADQIRLAVAGTIDALRNDPLPVGARLKMYEAVLGDCKEQNLAAREKSGGHHLREDMKQHETDCYQDLDCWWDTAFKLHVGFMCEDALQLKAKGEYAWSSFDKRWDDVSWGDARKETVKLTGKNLRIPNEAGVYVAQDHTCIYDREADLITQASIGTPQKESFGFTDRRQNPPLEWTIPRHESITPMDPMKQEFFDQVIDPCYEKAAKSVSLPLGMTVEFAVETMKDIGVEANDVWFMNLKHMLYPNKTERQRRAILRASRKLCEKNMTANMKRHFANQ